MDLPGLVGERLFSIFDINSDFYIGREEFVAGGMRLLSQSFEENARFVFELYDFDGDKQIAYEDIRTLMSYVPLNITPKNKDSKLGNEGLFTKNGGGL